ncbi:hypothetical protein BDZ89DRAFT_1036906 [Hymenopellis radicata]|nr:hypothetical protein BDZ89DRAFT_1036906 [Hymenopellis radicata]
MSANTRAWMGLVVVLGVILRRYENIEVQNEKGGWEPVNHKPVEVEENLDTEKKIVKETSLEEWEDLLELGLIVKTVAWNCARGSMWGVGTLQYKQCILVNAERNFSQGISGSGSYSVIKDIDMRVYSTARNGAFKNIEKPGWIPNGMGFDDEVVLPISPVNMSVRDSQQFHSNVVQKPGTLGSPTTPKQDTLEWISFVAAQPQARTATYP